MPAFTLPEAEILARPVKPEAAIAFWQSKAAMAREEAEKLEQGARDRAFFITGLARHSMVQEVKNAIGLALENGETFADFQTRIAHVTDSQGWQADRVETIFRNNMATAYMAGRWAGAQVSKKTRPYAMYVTVEDKHVRPNHQILHGKVYHLDHPFWAENWPPNGHRCRCDAITLSKRQAERRGAVIETELPGDSMWTDPATGMEYHVARPGADDGWRSNPGQSWLAGLTSYAAQQLETSDPDVAQAMVRRYVAGGFAAWTKNPMGDFPLVVVPQKDMATLGSTAAVGRLSAQTWAKQVKHHPELTIADYALAQDAVEHGEKYQQDARNIAYVLNQPGGVVVIVKATRKGDELYVTSLRRVSGKDDKRNEEVGRLKRGKK